MYAKDTSHDSLKITFFLLSNKLLEMSNPESIPIPITSFLSQTLFYLSMVLDSTLAYRIHNKSKCTEFSDTFVAF